MLDRSTAVEVSRDSRRVSVGESSKTGRRRKPSGVQERNGTIDLLQSKQVGTVAGVRTGESSKTPRGSAGTRRYDRSDAVEASCNSRGSFRWRVVESKSMMQGMSAEADVGNAR